MVSPALLFPLFYLLASPQSSSLSKNKRKSAGSVGTSCNKGRQRYSPKRKRVISTNPDDIDPLEQSDSLPLPPPPLTTEPDGPFPTYFTCRHTYEETLIEELNRILPTADDGQSNDNISSPFPGCVVLSETLDQLVDPVYALQMLPNCRIVKAQNSIKALARAILQAERRSDSKNTAGFMQLLARAPRGSLKIHALVPGMAKGQKDPVLRRRSYLLADALHQLLQKQFPAARKSDSDPPGEDWLLQVLLLSPDVAAVSLSRCSSLPNFPRSRWPNPSFPLGMAKVDIRHCKMPSSAYRKLLEAFACIGCSPSAEDIVVDLGASPGGWTAALLLQCHCRVVAVDRSKLDPKLMASPNVKFVQADAFRYRPPRPVPWMVSDVVAYPERVTELLDIWCGERLAQKMVVTVKFQGSAPSWESLAFATSVAQKHGYAARAKHFFNNKNEVTLMIVSQDTRGGSVGNGGAKIPSMYERAWANGA